MIKLISIIMFLLLSTGCTTLTPQEQEDRLGDDPQTIPLIIEDF